MVKIKLTRLGKKHEPNYRIVVMEENSKLSGDNLAILGHYRPLSKALEIDKKLLTEWLAKGAQPTDKVRRLLGL